MTRATVLREDAWDSVGWQVFSAILFLSYCWSPAQANKARCGVGEAPSVKEGKGQ